MRHLVPLRTPGEVASRLVLPGGAALREPPWRAIRQARNYLVVIGNGANYAFFINGEQVASVSDDRLKEGLVGVYLFSSTGSETATIEFDDFRLWMP